MFPPIFEIRSSGSPCWFFSPNLLPLNTPSHTQTTTVFREIFSSYLYAQKHPTGGAEFFQRFDRVLDIGEFGDHPFVKNQNLMILCVAATIRARIERTELLSPRVPYQCFLDRHPASYDHPKLSDICGFLSTLHFDAQLENEILVVGLAILNKLLTLTKNSLTIHARTWRPLVFTCMMVASKLQDDMSMISGNFAFIVRDKYFTLPQINEMELTLVHHILKFKLLIKKETFNLFLNAMIKMHNKIVDEIELRGFVKEKKILTRSSPTRHIWPIRHGHVPPLSPERQSQDSSSNNRPCVSHLSLRDHPSLEDEMGKMEL